MPQTPAGIDRFGTVRRLRADRGFGFLEGDDGIEYFFPASAVAAYGFDALAVDDRAAFVQSQEPVPLGKGPVAWHVRKA